MLCKRNNASNQDKESTDAEALYTLFINTMGQVVTLRWKHYSCLPSTGENVHHEKSQKIKEHNSVTFSKFCCRTTSSKTYRFTRNLFRAYLGHFASIFRICCQILLVLSVRAAIGKNLRPLIFGCNFEMIFDTDSIQLWPSHSKLARFDNRF